MFRHVPILCASLIFGCQTTPTDHLWALDKIWFAARTGQTYGFHTWTVYDTDWHGPDADQHHLCTLIVPLVATPTEPCIDCTKSWTIATDDTTSDCTNNVHSLAQWSGIRGISIAASGLSSIPNSPDGGIPVWMYSVHHPEWEPYGWTEEQETGDFSVTNPWVWRIPKTP